MPSSIVRTNCSVMPRNPISSLLTPILAQADVEYFKLLTKSPIMTNSVTRNELLNIA